jgi:ABC-type branched-subunit amino acid transport system substrate-binding protein
VRPRAGPERYYPEKKRSFVRLVPTDLEVADVMLEQIPSAAAGVAIVHTEGFAERELAGMLAFRLRRRGRPPVLVEPGREDPDARRALVDDLVSRRPGAIALAAAETAAARALLSELAIRLPSVPVVASPQLARRGGKRRVSPGTAAVTGVLPPRLQPAAGRRMLRSLGKRAPEALYGYDAMALTLDAIEAGGPDRRKVVAAALRPRQRTGVTGRYAVRRNGAVGGRRLAVVDLGRDRLSVRGVVP